MWNERSRKRAEKESKWKSALLQEIMIRTFQIYFLVVIVELGVVVLFVFLSLGCWFVLCFMGSCIQQCSGFIPGCPFKYHSGRTWGTYGMNRIKYELGECKVSIYALYYLTSHPNLKNDIHLYVQEARKKFQIV